MARSMCVLLFVVCLGSLGAAFAEDRAPFADPIYVPPSPVKSNLPLPASTLRQCLDALQTVHVYHDFEGMTEALRNASPPRKGEMLRGGELIETGLSNGALLGAPIMESFGFSIYAASFLSVDADGIKLRLNVSGLKPGEEAWVLDPDDMTAFGPYVATAGGEAEQWAAAVFGDEAVLLVKSPNPETPDLAVPQFSHLFRSADDAAKNLWCNIDIACSDDPGSIAASSAVGLVIIEGVGYCSGTLVNNPLTAAYEPLFLTANHCICSQDEATNTEVVWDFRSDSCSAAPPDYTSLPLRSYGVGMLVTDAPLDSTLILLDEVEAGPYGRSYLGWDARQLVPNEAVKCIHHPDRTHMRVTTGTVREINDDLNGRQEQTMVHWDVGVTERGSSGSCLLLDNEAEANRIVGTLSQGPDHSCTSNINNVDWFSSFHLFYPQLQPYINQNPASTALGADECSLFPPPPDDPTCPFSTAYSAAPAALTSLRAIRDHVLMPTPAGRTVVDVYYKSGPAVAPLVAQSPAVKGAVIAVSAPFVRAGALIRLFAK